MSRTTLKRLHLQVRVIAIVIPDILHAVMERQCSMFYEWGSDFFAPQGTFQGLSLRQSLASHDFSSALTQVRASSSAVHNFAFTLGILDMP